MLEIYEVVFFHQYCIYDFLIYQDCPLLNHRASDPDPTLILVLTYLRSGSTLTGDILQQSPKSFYMYEPLRSYKSNIFLDGQICNIFTMNCS